MRGPLGGIFQNVSITVFLTVRFTNSLVLLSQFLLICIVLNCGICLLVNVPFIIGKVHLTVSSLSRLFKQLQKKVLMHVPSTGGYRLSYSTG